MEIPSNFFHGTGTAWHRRNFGAARRHGTDFLSPCRGTFFRFLVVFSRKFSLEELISTRWISIPESDDRDTILYGPYSQEGKDVFSDIFHSEIENYKKVRRLAKSRKKYPHRLEI